MLNMQNISIGCFDVNKMLCKNILFSIFEVTSVGAVEHPVKVGLVYYRLRTRINTR